MRNFVKYFWSLATLSSVTHGIDWSYDVVKQSGKFCPERDSCSFGRKSRDTLDTMEWKSRNCFCDHLCQTFGDCCVDSKFFTADTQRRVYGSYECRQLKQYDNILIRSQCPGSWSGSDRVRQGCEEEDTDLSDPVRSMPVTNTESGVTYRNHLCAVCNGDTRDPDQLQLWSPRLECQTLQVRFEKDNPDFFTFKEMISNDTYLPTSVLTDSN